jgi:hypothetical protein
MMSLLNFMTEFTNFSSCFKTYLQHLNIIFYMQIPSQHIADS